MKILALYFMNEPMPNFSGGVIVKCFALCSKVRYFVVVRNAVGVDSRASSDMSNGVLQLYGKRAQFIFFCLITKVFFVQLMS